MAWFDGLTEKQRRFCEEYAANGGNALAAAKASGYKQPNQQSSENLEKPSIKSALEALRKETTSKAICTREERQAFWTAIMRDAGEKTTDRLKASELMGKSQADFLDRVDHSNSDGSMKSVEVVFVRPD